MRLGGPGVLELVDHASVTEARIYECVSSRSPRRWTQTATALVTRHELNTLPFANPLNAAETVSSTDGAIYVPDEAAFEAISHHDNFPGAPNVQEVKFLIMNVDGPKPELYFLNANQHVYHYYFAIFVLGYPFSLSTFNSQTYFTNTTRRNLAGSLIVHENYTPPGGGPPGIITMEFLAVRPCGISLCSTGVRYDHARHAVGANAHRISRCEPDPAHPLSIRNRALQRGASVPAARHYDGRVVRAGELFAVKSGSRVWSTGSRRCIDDADGARHSHIPGSAQ
jgi:hypothetical protein